jgi:tRNA-Thr(GGU) m(6)t(6)A37 methyltransferase TsaA
MDEMTITPVAFVKNTRKEPVDDCWGGMLSEIELIDGLPGDALDGIDAFSHLEILYYFHRSVSTVTGSEHPRENRAWPKVGIFAQRKKDRPNHLGTTFVNLVRREGRKLVVANLDAVDGTPVIDIKPVMAEFMPKGTIEQPPWATELMAGYWKSPTCPSPVSA